ncbi:DUF4367 domain-containing protein [Peptoniphilus sp. HCN-40583]|uniref:DUF4367 domain-containing protein n=1 Tax=Peptoniphilus sp. HCN-40583 TaxID=3134662 RepID=UPI0030BAD585
MNDRQFDLWIKNAMEKNAEEEIRTLEEQWTSDHDRVHTPSFETDRKILKAIGKSKKKNPLKKAAAVLLVAGIGLVSLFAFHGDVLAQMQSYVEAWFSDHTAIHFTQKEKIEKKDWDITYVPKGFKVSKIEKLDEGYQITFFENEKGKSFSFECVAKDGAFTIGEDNENGERKKINIGKNEAFLYVSKREGFSNSITIEKEDYIFILDGDVTVDELIKMAESIREKK